MTECKLEKQLIISDLISIIIISLWNLRPARADKGAKVVMNKCDIRDDRVVCADDIES
jgi:hypothetical protein